MAALRDPSSLGTAEIPPWMFTPRRGAWRRRVAVVALLSTLAMMVLITSRDAAGGSADPTSASASAPAPASGSGSGAAAAGVPAPAQRATPRAITLNWVGDLAVSSAQGLPPDGLESALAPVRSALRDADLTLGNLEGTLSTGGSSKCGRASGASCFAFQAPPSLAGQLRDLGFGLVNQANNHSMDYGEAGREQTLAALRHYGLPYTGTPGQITTLSVHGVRVAFLGFAPYRYDADLRDIPGAQAMIRQAHRQAQVVVVIIHAGAEGSAQTHTPEGDEVFLGEDRGDTRGFAHAAIDAGASIVVGSGPHVPRGVEAYHGHLIAYSLGNFVGYRTLGLGGTLSDSGILHVTLGPTGNLLAARWISIRLLDGLPAPDPSNASAKLVGTLSAQDFPSDHFVIDGSGAFHA
jgi:hypothetical protein